MIEPRHVKPPKPAHVASMRMTGWENFWWLLGNIVTGGYFYFRKVCMKRAMIEAMIAYGAIPQVVYPAPSAPSETPQRPIIA